MDFTQHTSKHALERYAFYWLLALLVVSAGALFLDARPPITLLTGSSSTIWSLLNLSWIISGAAAVYMAYQWVQHEKRVFGGTDNKDMVAFLFMVVSGLNVGILGVLSINIYFQIMMGYIAFVITGVVSLAVAGYLFKRWKENGEQLFHNATQTEPVKEAEPAAEADQMSQGQEQEQESE